MTEKLISIIVPVYNVEKYLEQCLNSIFVDNFFPEFNELIEVIAVNDGSTDNSAAILERYAEKRPLTIINQDNRGLPSARNTGTKSATGRYIQYIDSDDYIFPDTLEKIAHYLKKTGCDLLLFDFARFTDGKKDFKEKRTATNEINGGCGQIALKSLLNHHLLYVVAWNKIISRELIVKYDLFFTEHIIHEDVEWCPRLFAFAENVGYLPLTVYAYRQRQGSISAHGVRDNKSYRNNLAILDLLNNFANNNNFPDDFKQTLYRTMHRMFWDIWINANFENEVEQLEEKYGHFMRYCNWHRKSLCRPLIKLIGIENFCKLTRQK